MTSPWHRFFGNFLGRLLNTTLIVGMVGVANSPAIAATGPTVDQQPLTLQPNIPSNIMLMVDDSGSMAWDFMPDAAYLSGAYTVQNGWYQDTLVNLDALRSAAVNGAYYNPAVTYNPPPTATGSSYANSPGIGNAYLNGFQGSTQVDVTHYASNSFCEYNGYPSTQSGCPSSLYGYFQYYTAISTSSTTIYLFTYTTRNANGSYTRNYVGKSASDCAAAPAGSSCDFSAATQQNVANWFSYYRTRMLMAKSGLMTAFSTVSSSFRVGFGSIDGGCNGNARNLPASSSSIYSYADSYSCIGSNTLANVQPFGSNQKNAFWNWASKLTPSGGTPLRLALNAVGTYYTTSQPWSTMSTDPSSVSSSTEIACRQSYTILTSDGFWNESNNSFTIPNSGSNSGNVDGNAMPTQTGPNGRTY